MAALRTVRRQPAAMALQRRGEPGTVPPGGDGPTSCMEISWTDILPRRDLLRALTSSET